MHYQNDTFLFILQEVSLKYHKSSIKYHKSSIKTALKLHNEAPKEPLSSNATTYKQLTSTSKQLTSTSKQLTHDIAQKPSQTLGTRCPKFGQQMPNTWSVDAHHVGSECPPNGHRQTN